MARLRTLALQTVTLAATPERLSATDLVKQAFVITNPSANAGNIRVAEFGQVSSTNGTTIASGQSYAINPSGIWGKEETVNLKDIGVSVDNDGDKVSVSYLEI